MICCFTYQLSMCSPLKCLLPSSLFRPPSLRFWILKILKTLNTVRLEHSKKSDRAAKRNTGHWIATGQILENFLVFFMTKNLQLVYPPL